jgi:L-ascorbate metabolism protein UlaG (beta-lactamase superfamily)
MDEILCKFLPKASGQTAGWYQQYITEGFELYFLPARHWAKRGLNDTNRRLWGSFLLKINGKTIYFGGDSGYGSHYKDIAKLFPEIDYAILGIGAYEPEWFMQDNHSSPEKAYQAFKDLKARYFIPMHYGTFDLSDEPIGKPQRELEKIKELQQDNSVIIPILGENLLR